MTILLLLATVIIGAAVQLAAAAEDLHAELHYSNHYDNNLQPLHHYFYQWPEGSHSTYSPTGSPADGIVIPTSMPTPSPHTADQSVSTSSSPTPTSPTLSNPARTASSEWNVLAHEHFLDGFGVFKEVEPRDVHHYPSILGREGVIQLQKSATLPSYDIAVDSSSQLKVEFSFYANSMNIGEGFCLEYSLNDETEWNPVRCWQSSIDFENSQWHDDFNVELHLDDSRIQQVDSLRIKFESIASRDNVDVMFDRISLLQFR
eukprot:scaffold16098_cov80-Skeletonema_menzelii.AAC.8